MSGSLKIALVSVCLGLFGVTVTWAAGGEKADGAITQMTLPDAVFLAIRNNRTLKSAYLDRVVQKFNLKVAEEEFIPKVNINPAVRSGSIAGDDGTRTDTDAAEVAYTVRQRLPTGADFVFSWTNLGTWNDEDDFTSGLDLSFRQPLLRGGGVEVNTASLNISRLNEESNILSLRSTAIGIVTTTIFAYRRFLQAKQQLEIAQNSLKRAERLLEVNEELINAGRMARVEIVQAQAEVANREFSLVQSENALDAARLALLQVLDIDKRTRVDPVEPVDIKSMDLKEDRLLPVAFEMRNDYLQSLLRQRVAEIELIVARNNRLWNLDVVGAYGLSATNEDRIESALKGSFDADRSNWQVGLSLNIPVNDLTRDQRVVGAKTNLNKQTLSLAELKDNIEIEVQDAVRDVRMKLRQLELARQSRKLAGQKLEIEKEKLQVGRSTNFQLVTFQNDLVNAENSELNATIDYLNALTGLDQTLGTTLQTWKIDVKD